MFLDTITRDQLARAMAEFEAKGGQVVQCAPGERALNHVIDPALAGCTCGCKGNYTDHTMREGEHGRPAWMDYTTDYAGEYAGQ
jgi:hypothetical protein